MTMVVFTLLLGYVSSVTNFQSSLEPITFPWLLESLFFVSALFGNTFPVLGQGWSLEYEMFFYLLVTVGLMFRRKSIVFLGPVVILVILVGTSLISAMVVEFLLGMLIAISVQKFKQVGLEYAVASLLISLLLFGLSQVLADSAPEARYLWIPASAFLVFAAVWLPQIRSSLVLELGSASYAVYLFHGFTYSLTVYVFGVLAPQGGAVAVMVCVLASLLFAEVIGVLFERYIDSPPEISSCEARTLSAQMITLRHASASRVETTRRRC